MTSAAFITAPFTTSSAPTWQRQVCKRARVPTASRPPTAMLLPTNLQSSIQLLAVNEKLYADIIKGSFGIIAATFASTIFVGIIARSKLDYLEEQFQARDKSDGKPPPV